MFNIINTVSRRNQTKVEDTANIKTALTVLGYYDDSETGLSPYADNQLFQSIELFQKDQNLEVDGVLKPKGETEQKIKDSLKNDKKAGNAFGDFKRNQENLKKTTSDADKYFHCVANYEATERGWDGEVAAHVLSNAKEIIAGIPQIMKHGVKITVEDSKRDQRANKYGRQTAKSGQYDSAQEACSVFRPEGLDEKY